MGHVIFALDAQVFIKITMVNRDLNTLIKPHLCICEALSYIHGTMETTFVGMATIKILQVC